MNIIICNKNDIGHESKLMWRAVENYTTNMSLPLERLPVAIMACVPWAMGMAPQQKWHLWHKNKKQQIIKAEHFIISLISFDTAISFHPPFVLGNSLH